MQNIETIKKHALELIKEKKTKEALDYLSEHVEDDNKSYIQLILLSAGFNRLIKEEQEELVKNEDIKIRKNKINHALAAFVEELGASSTNKVKKEPSKIQKIKDHAHQLITEGKTSKAMDYLLEQADNYTHLKEKLITQSSKLKKLIQEQRLGLMDTNTLNIRQNQINSELMKIIDKLDKPPIIKTKPKPKSKTTIPSNEKKWHLILFILLVLILLVVLYIAYKLS